MVAIHWSGSFMCPMSAKPARAAMQPTTCAIATYGSPRHFNTVNHDQLHAIDGARNGIRTHDPRSTNPLLFHLSYPGGRLW